MIISGRNGQQSKAPQLPVAKSDDDKKEDNFLNSHLDDLRPTDDYRLFPTQTSSVTFSLLIIGLKLSEVKVHSG